MKIGIIGATGKAGRNLLREALSRGHEVTAIVRNKQKLINMLNTSIPVIEKDIFDLTTEDLHLFDVLVNAISAPLGKEYLHVAAGRHLISLLENTETKLIVIGGAGSLFVNSDYSTRLLHTPSFPSEFKATAEAQLQNLLDLQQSSIRWTFVSPSRLFDSSGPRTGHYIKGKDRLLFNSQQISYVSYADCAVAILDEIENPQHENERFTIASENATTTS